MSVVSLPRWFVFRPSGDDPHPTPWIRVQLSCAMGAALYPHAQWEALGRLRHGIRISVVGRITVVERITALRRHSAALNAQLPLRKAPKVAAAVH